MAYLAALSKFPTIRPEPAKGYVCMWMLANARSTIRIAGS